jgi:hypothetical protein
MLERSEKGVKGTRGRRFYLVPSGLIVMELTGAK